MTEVKPGEVKSATKPPESGTEAQKDEKTAEVKPNKAEPKKTSQMPLTIFYHWCKACNICIAFCPQKVFIPDRDGKPIIEHPEKCTQCAICWMHCPDLAIVSNEK